MLAFEKAVHSDSVLVADLADSSVTCLDDPTVDWMEMHWGTQRAGWSVVWLACCSVASRDLMSASSMAPVKVLTMAGNSGILTAVTKEYKTASLLVVLWAAASGLRRAKPTAA